jgi:hypothetical protein
LSKLREKLELELAARGAEAPRSDAEPSGNAVLLAESQRQAKALEASVRELEKRHKESQRECEVLRRRLQSALKPSTADSALADQHGGDAAPAAPAATSADPAPPTIPSSQSDPVARWRAAREQAVAEAASRGASSQKPQSAAEVSKPAAQKPQHHGAEGESVESYMQQLLARSRRTATADAPWTAPPTLGPSVAPSPERREAEPISVVTPTDVEPLPLPEPSHRQDKASVRADLDSLRNVANTAARTAIAKYSSRATREKVLYRSLLATLSVLVAAVLLSSVFWGNGNYMHIGWLAAAASGALALDVLRTSGKLRFLRSRNERALTRNKAAESRPDSKPDENP